MCLWNSAGNQCNPSGQANAARLSEEFTSPKGRSGPCLWLPGGDI